MHLELLLAAARVPAPGSEATETTVDLPCQNSGQLCDLLYEVTDSETVAEVTSFILGSVRRR